MSTDTNPSTDRATDQATDQAPDAGGTERLRKGMRPDRQEPTLPTLGTIGMLRWGWRQLTSMRTALFLLLLLSIAAVPGSIFPQRNIDAGRVADYIAQNPTSSPWLDKLGFFDVYASPWFSAIYLLLFGAPGELCSVVWASNSRGLPKSRPGVSLNSTWSLSSARTNGGRVSVSTQGPGEIVW